MPDNPNSPAFALPGQSVLEISGPDAVAFMQAQCMNDITPLADGQWQWNGWLTPQGRLIALFALLRRDAQTLWCVLPDSPAAALAQQLQRYVFRAKVKLRPREDLQVGGSFVRDTQIPLAEDAATLDLSTDAGQRAWVIATTPFAVDAAAESHWRETDLRHGLPRLAADAEPKWTPQQLSLDRLNAYSVKKGCYPGQEIVARTHFLGQPKRGLMLLDTAQPVAAGTQVSDGTRDVGTVISTAGDLALAVASLDATPATIDGHGVKQLPLLDGLVR
ncbi:MAG: folate-binding protein YgfZ [Proteobacteria bacterium]|nr:folate-binding protein YgfZ [Pseudomonadota bacterium]